MKKFNNELLHRQAGDLKNSQNEVINDPKLVGNHRKVISKNDS